MGLILRSSRRCEDVLAFVESAFKDDLHAKRIMSLAHATYGVMAGASLGVTIIGQTLAQARGILMRSAIKQVDRLLSNTAIDVWDMFARWVPEVTGHNTDLVIAMDWTDFDADGHTTLSLNLTTTHGRAMPLLWLTVLKEDLKDRRNEYKDRCLTKLAQILPPGVKVTILADRGFGDTKLFQFLPKLGFDYVIRFRGNILVTAANGERRMAGAWVGQGGRAVKLKTASLTAAQVEVPAVVCVHAQDMKEPWCLASSKGSASSRDIINLYAKRWTIEPSFRDTKDIRFGMGMNQLQIARPDRRDRLFLVNAMVMHLLTILGAAGESLGMDRQLRTSTTKRRTHSLFNQGCILYDLIVNMPEFRLAPLMERFYEFMQNSPAIAPLMVT